MRNQPVRSTPQQRLTLGLGLLALYLVASILAGSLAPHGGVLSVFGTILASIAMLSGLLGLLLFAARHYHWWLPSLLQLPEERQDYNWRILVVSLALIALPMIVIVAQQLLFHS